MFIDPKVSPIQKKVGPTPSLPEPSKTLIPLPIGIDEGKTPDQDKAPVSQLEVMSSYTPIKGEGEAPDQVLRRQTMSVWKCCWKELYLEESKMNEQRRRKLMFQRKGDSFNQIVQGSLSNCLREVCFKYLRVVQLERQLGAMKE